MDADTFRAGLKTLGLSYAQAAEILGVHSRQRIADFCAARRPVPPYLAAALSHRIQSLKRKAI